MAELAGFITDEIDVLHEKEFRIVFSEKGERGAVHISPDIAVCDDCLRELFDPRDRKVSISFHQLYELRSQIDDYQGSPI